MTVGPDARRRGRPPQLSREQILDAVASAGNVDTLTMRELAARLDVRHGALYRWIKNRDELFDLVSEMLVDRVLAGVVTAERGWRNKLAAIARSMHDQFLAVPGYATHLSRPHPHHAGSTRRLREAVTAAFAQAGLDERLAEQNWYIFVTAVVGWLAFEEQPHHLDPAAPDFDIFLAVLLRGLPGRPPEATGQPRRRSGQPRPA